MGRPNFLYLHISSRKAIGTIYNDSLTPLGNGNKLTPNAADTQRPILCHPYCHPLGMPLGNSDKF